MQKKVLWVLFGTLLLDMVGIGMVFPIIPILFTDPSSSAFMLEGFSQTWQFFIAGAVVGVGGIMQFFAAPLLGELSDVYGRRRLLMVGVGILALSQAVFGFGISVASLALLFVSRVFAGLAAANFSIAQAAVADVTKPEDRARNFGLIGAAFGIGFILGPLLGGWISGATGNPAAPFWFSALLGIVNALFIFFLLPETNQRRTAKAFTFLKGIRNIRDAFLDRDASPVYLAGFLYMSGFAFFTTFIGVLLVNRFDFTEVGVGTFFGVVGIWIVFAQAVVVGYFARRYRERSVLFGSFLLLAGAVGAYPFLTSVTALYVVMPLVAIAQGLSMANTTALISRGVSESKQGAALGINGSLMALSQGVIPLVAGTVTGVVGLTAPFLVGALVILSAWAVLFVLPPRT